MKRIYFILTILIIMTLVVTSCSSQSPNGDQSPSDEDKISLTLSELAEYDGKDGNPAYVAVDGVIYDVSDSNLWTNGDHNGFEAGRDLSEGIKSSPHGVAILSRMPIVGEIVD